MTLNGSYMLDQYAIRFYPFTPVLGFPHRCYTRDDGTVTGTMDQDGFEELKSSIQEDGIINPFIVEFFEIEGSNVPALCIRVGNNRAVAMSQLGQECGPVLFVIPRHLLHKLPNGTSQVVPINSSLLSRIRVLWREVGRAGDLPDAWMDSNLLLEIVRNTLPDPNLLTRQRSKNHEA